MRNVALAGLLLLGLLQVGCGSEPVAAGAPPGTGVAVTVHNVAGANPVVRRPWLAWNDGDGPWRPLPGDGPDYVFRSVSGRYGLAIVCDRADGTLSWQLIHASVAEQPAVVTVCADPAPDPDRVLSGKIASVPDGAKLSLRFSSGYLRSAGDAGPVRTYEATVRDGIIDLAALAVGGGEATAAIVRRGVTIAGDTTLDLDFAVDPLPLVTKPLTIENLLKSQRVDASVRWSTERGAGLTLPLPIAEQPDARTYVSIAGTALAPGDSQRLGVTSIDGGTVARSVSRVFRAGEAMTLALPPVVFVPDSVTKVQAGGQLLPSITFQPYPGAILYSVSASDANGATNRGASITPGWLEQRRSYTFPDLSALPGWRTTWGLAGGSQPTLMIIAVTSNRDLATTYGPAALTADGLETKGSMLLVPLR